MVAQEHDIDPVQQMDSDTTSRNVSNLAKMEVEREARQAAAMFLPSSSSSSCSSRRVIPEMIGFSLDDRSGGESCKSKSGRLVTMAFY